MYLYKATNKRPINIFQYSIFGKYMLYIYNTVENCNSMENLA